MPVAIDALIMAAGAGRRFGSSKQFARFGEKRLVAVTAALFLNNTAVDKVYLAYPPDMRAEDFLREGELPEEVIPVPGGDIREISVLNALKSSSADYVLIHDAARPLVPSEVIERVIDTMLKEGAAVPAVKMTSTLKYLNEDGTLSALDRDRVFEIQTPQGYRRESILRAYEGRKSRGYTDSSSVANEAGIRTPLVEGSVKNIKITIREDLEMLKEGREERE